MFDEWGGDLSGNEFPIQITVSTEKNVTVRFDYTQIYLGDNGITIMCPDAPVGIIGIFDGAEYQVVDRELLIQRRDDGSDMSRVCVSNVTDMSEIFRQRTVNGDITGWDVSSVTSMFRMFESSQFNQPINNWDVSSVTDMDRLFQRSEFN